MTIPFSWSLLHSRALGEVIEVLLEIVPVMPHVTAQESVIYHQTLRTLLFYNTLYQFGTYWTHIELVASMWVVCFAFSFACVYVGYI
jgi:hypothetical protein